MIEQILALALVFGLLGLLALWTRKRSPVRRRLDVVESTALGQGRTVVVVRAGS